MMFGYSLKVSMYLVGFGIFLGLLFIWVGYLSYVVLKERKYLEELFPQGESRQIRGKLREVLAELNEVREENTLIAQKLDLISKEILGHIQKLEILRYNPYNDTGGDQSFSIILLDGKLNGCLITSLHSRSGTRIYTKIVKSGTSDLDLSKEEKELLEKAVNKN